MTSAGSSSPIAVIAVADLLIGGFVLGLCVFLVLAARVLWVVLRNDDLNDV